MLPLLCAGKCCTLNLSNSAKYVVAARLLHVYCWGFALARHLICVTWLFYGVTLLCVRVCCVPVLSAGRERLAGLVGAAA